MKRRFFAPLLAGVIATLSLATVSAQSPLPPWVFVQDSAGQVWMIGKDGVRVAIPLYPASDDEIAQTTWIGGWMVPKPDGSGLTGGPRPEWASGTPPSVGVPVAAAPVPEAPSPPVIPPPAPPPPVLVAAAPAPVTKETVKLSGDTAQNTRPFDLGGGSYAAQWETKLRRGQTSCFTSARLYRVDGKRLVDSVYSLTLNEREGRTSASGETQLYGVIAGQHYLDVNETGCSWSVTLTPQ